MARLSTDERLERLQRRYNELVKPVFLIGNSFASGINAVTILSNGKREERRFKSLEIFQSYADSLTDCNIILDNKVLSFRGDTLKAAIAEASTEDLHALVYGNVTEPIIKRVLYDGIAKQIS